MKLLVIGASHGVGLNVVQQALQEGHGITTVARRPDRMVIRHKRLTVIKGDILDSRIIEEAVNGQDAVCVAIGAKPIRRYVYVFSRGTHYVVEAMKRVSCRRLVCVTGIGAGESKGHGGFLYDRIFHPLLLKPLYEDKDRQEFIVRESGLDWVIVRPGFLTNGPRTGRFHVLTDLTEVTASRISRADVAHFILQETREMRYRSQAPLLTY